MPRKPPTPRKLPVGADGAKRVARTGAQLALPTLFVQGFNLFASPEHHMTSEQASWIIVAGGLLIGFCQNVLEEQGVIHPWLKGPTPTPLTDPPAQRELIESMAAVQVEQHNALLDLRADIAALRPPEPVIFTEQAHSPARAESPAPWQPGGLG